jgi:hypothetical protein
VRFYGEHERKKIMRQEKRVEIREIYQFRRRKRKSIKE